MTQERTGSAWSSRPPPRRFASGVVFGAALIAAMPAAAHHSGLYDEQNVGTITGTISAVAWINPHVRLTVEARDDGGTVQSWEVEGTSMNALERWGVTGDSFAIGDAVSVTGPRSRFGRNTMVGAIMRLEDGRSVLLWPNIATRLGLAEPGTPARLYPPPASAAGAAPSGDVSVFRVWTPRGRGTAPEPSALPLTASARAARATYEPLEDDPALRCEPPGMPVMLDTPYPVEFVDRGDHILLRFEEWDGERIVYMDPRNGPTRAPHSPKGVSFGRWDGVTLAIFTTYIDYPYFDDVGTPQSKDVTVLERYTPRSDANGLRLDWQWTVTDPATFTAPVVRTGYMSYEPGEVIKPYDCTLLEPAR